VTELERKHLVETDRHIAECKEYIAKQHELIQRAIKQGRSTEVAETTLEALEVSLRAFERQRRLLLHRLKSASDDHHRQEPDHDLRAERIVIYRPKDAGTYVIELRTAAGEALAISIPASETRVVRRA